MGRVEDEDDDNGPPTRPESGTVDVFRHTCTEAMERLGILALDEEGKALMHEASQLVTILDGWRVVPPRSAADRPTIIARVFELHRRSYEYAARRRAVLFR